MDTKYKEARVRAGLTQTEAAHRARLSQSYLSRVERGICAPTERALRRLARAYSVAPESLALSDLERWSQRSCGRVAS